MKKNLFNKVTGLALVSALAMTGLTACSSTGAAGSNTANNAASSDTDNSESSSQGFRTLDEIKESGVINIGVFSDKSPFGYVDENGDYAGYDVYLAERLGQDLGVEINYVSTEAANRIEYLQTGKVDIILANFTVTEERAQEKTVVKEQEQVSVLVSRGSVTHLYQGDERGFSACGTSH